MSDTLGNLERFIANWRGKLEREADLFFTARRREGGGGMPSHVADKLAKACGFGQIGMNWEMLDPDADAAGSRSARGAFVDALAKDLVFKSDWLGAEDATSCGDDFVAAFDPSQVMILTNHIIREGGISEGWFGITGATFEWAFVGFDDHASALLIVSGED
jgi:hypothetical protein